MLNSLRLPVTLLGTASLLLAACDKTPPPTPTPSGDFSARVLALTNAARAKGGACGGTTYAATTPLSLNTQLVQAAQAHASDMANHNFFNHNSQNGTTPAERITATGYKWLSVGENIAAGQTTPEEVVASWLTSPEHCVNLMDPNFKEIGIGFAENASTTYHTYWVQDFGQQ